MKIGVVVLVVCIVLSGALCGSVKRSSFMKGDLISSLQLPGICGAIFPQTNLSYVEFSVLNNPQGYFVNPSSSPQSMYQLNICDSAHIDTTRYCDTTFEGDWAVQISKQDRTNCVALANSSPAQNYTISQWIYINSNLEKSNLGSAITYWEGDRDSTSGKDRYTTIYMKCVAPNATNQGIPTIQYIGIDTTTYSDAYIYTFYLEHPSACEQLIFTPKIIALMALIVATPFVLILCCCLLIVVVCVATCVGCGCCIGCCCKAASSSSKPAPTRTVTTTYYVPSANTSIQQPLQQGRTTSFYGTTASEVPTIPTTTYSQPAPMVYQQPISSQDNENAPLRFNYLK